MRCAYSSTYLCRGHAHEENLREEKLLIRVMAQMHVLKSLGFVSTGGEEWCVHMPWPRLRREFSRGNASLRSGSGKHDMKTGLKEGHADAKKLASELSALTQCGWPGDLLVCVASETHGCEWGKVMLVSSWSDSCKAAGREERFRSTRAPPHGTSWSGAS